MLSQNKSIYYPVLKYFSNSVFICFCFGFLFFFYELILFILYLYYTLFL